MTIIARMTSQIRSVRTLWKNGAYGDPSKEGFYVYGKRPDGKTVPCHHERRADGSVTVWSTWRSPSCKAGERERCSSDFSASEWAQINMALDGLGSYLCNQILDRRK
jgi:hypothetical protein